MKSKITDQGDRQGQGRKALPKGEAMILFALRMKPAQIEKLQRPGGAAWVRERIDRAKEPQD